MTRLDVAQAWAEEYTPPNERAIEMARLYAEEGLSYAQIGERYGISRQRVHQILRPFGLTPHWGKRRARERLDVITAAYERVLAGESLTVLADELGYANGESLRNTFLALGLHMPRSSPEHGTRYRYDEGCRCDACIVAMRAYKQAQSEREPPEHGVSGYFNFACRCQVCTEAGRRYQRQKNIERRQAKEPE